MKLHEATVLTWFAAYWNNPVSQFQGRRTSEPRAIIMRNQILPSPHRYLSISMHIQMRQCIKHLGNLLYPAFIIIHNQKWAIFGGFIPIPTIKIITFKSTLPSCKLTVRYGKTPSLSSVKQIFLWTMFNSYVTNYQRVIDSISIPILVH